MTMLIKYEHHHYYHTDQDTAGRLRRIEQLLSDNTETLETMMTLLDDLSGKMDAANASIQKNSDLDDSILAALAAESQQIKDLKAALDAAGTDPARLQALSDAMTALITKSDAEAQKKADAITANTPAATP